MQVNADLTSGKCTLNPIGSRLHRSRGELLILTFTEENAARLLVEGEVVKLAIKAKGKRDAGLIALVSISLTDYDVATSSYRKYFSTVTPAALKLLAIDGDSANDSVLQAIELGIVFFDTAGLEHPTDFFEGTFENGPYNENDGTPDELPSPADFVAGMALCFDREQTFTPTEIWQALNNLGITYDAGLGGIPITLPSGDAAFIPITTVPA